MDKDDYKADSKWLKQLRESQEIVKKINDFGVTQFQILKIIESLSLELENRDAMLAIKDAVRVAIEASEIELREQKELIL